jgi:hypothetical protein
MMTKGPRDFFAPTQVDVRARGASQGCAKASAAERPKP